MDTRISQKVLSVREELLATCMEIASKMFFEIEMVTRPAVAVLFFFCFAQIGSINGISGKLIILLQYLLELLLKSIVAENVGYIFITQPPTDLLCNPHSSSSDASLRLECSIGVLESTELPADTSILWYRRAPRSTETEQLCGSSVAKFMAASPFAEKSVGLRSMIEVTASSSKDLIGEYWCQVAKARPDGSTLLSNRSTVLEIRTKDYYNRNKDLSRCEAGTIFLELITSLESVEFSSSISSPLTADNSPCPMDPIATQFSPERSTSTVDPDSVSEDDSFSLPRMWVYILAPVIATLLIFLFLFLLIALVATCFQKRDSRKGRLPSTIGRSY